jgi:hypothetical protein
MSMYEVMAAGGTYLVPSARFFQQELLPQLYNNTWETCRCDFLWHLPEWQSLVDWWHPDLQEGLLYFDSWRELQGMLDGSTGEALPRLIKRGEAAKAAAARIMAREQQKSLAAFRRLLLRVAQGGRPGGGYSRRAQGGGGGARRAADAAGGERRLQAAAGGGAEAQQIGVLLGGARLALPLAGCVALLAAAAAGYAAGAAGWGRR